MQEEIIGESSKVYENKQSYWRLVKVQKTNKYMTWNSQAENVFSQ